MKTSTTLNDDASRLAGLWAVVTGGTGGIGSAIVAELAAGGANVVVHGFRREKRAQELVESIRAFGVSSEAILCDLSSDRARASLVERAWALAPIDIWVNNAGADVLTGEAADWSFDEKLAALWSIDVQGTLLLSREVGARMKKRGTGSIVNIGWDQAATGMEGDSGQMFAATKGAIMAFTRGLAKSLAPEVRVNCVAPGWIKTEWGRDASEYWQQRAVDESLLERWGTPEDVAQAVGWLASPKASFITGQVLPVNGGLR